MSFAVAQCRPFDLAAGRRLLVRQGCPRRCCARNAGQPRSVRWPRVPAGKGTESVVWSVSGGVGDQSLGNNGRRCATSFSQEAVGDIKGGLLLRVLVGGHGGGRASVASNGGLLTLFCHKHVVQPISEQGGGPRAVQAAVAAPGGGIHTCTRDTARKRGCTTQGWGENGDLSQNGAPFGVALLRCRGRSLRGCVLLLPSCMRRDVRR